MISNKNFLLRNALETSIPPAIKSIINQQQVQISKKMKNSDFEKWKRNAMENVCLLIKEWDL